MAATQRRTLSIAPSLHLKQEPLNLRAIQSTSLLHQSQQQPSSPPSNLLVTDEDTNEHHPKTNGHRSSVSSYSDDSPVSEKSPNKLERIVEDAASPEAKRVVEMIVSQVQQLSTAEKLLLYLKLPGGRNGTASTPDPLRQPLNPLGTRFEIQQTITWIRTHLMEDPDISLPKQDVYDEYMAYCGTNQMKPLSTADFGKVMKQVFPKVRPRRLGTRGNSRYCYAGLCKLMKLGKPLLPDLGVHKDPQKGEDNLEMAASVLIREWAQKLLGEKFNTLKELASYLVDKMCVDGKSAAAFTIMSDIENNKEGSSTAKLPINRKDSSTPAKDIKRKYPQENERAVDGQNSRPASGCKKSRLKNGRSSVECPIRKNDSKKRQSPAVSIETSSPVTTTTSTTTTSTPTPKMPIPRLPINNKTSNGNTSIILISPSQPKQLQPMRKKYKLIQPKPEPLSHGDEALLASESLPVLTDAAVVQGLEQDALDDYLQCGNSQEQEEELLKYFQNDTASPNSVHVEPTPQPEEKISHLRQLLERGYNNDPNATLNTRRRVSFETTALDPVPPSPNTRRKNFNFCPISPDAAPGISQAPPPSPAARNSVTSSSTATSPFVSPRNTPVLSRSRHNSGQQFVFPLGRTRHSSNGSIATTSQKSLLQVTRPRSYLLKNSTVISQQQFSDFTEPISESTLTTDISLEALVAANQRQRHMSAGPQIHLQLNQNLDSFSQEVSSLLANEPLPSILPAFRSHSVPIHQMTSANFSNFNSTIAPTPVPSEFTDFLDSDTSFDPSSYEGINQFLIGNDDVIEPKSAFSSRSYPNTPIAELASATLTGININESMSRSYPSTPVMPDPLLTLNALNHQATSGTLGAARRNLAELLEQTNNFDTESYNSNEQVTFTGGVGVVESVNFVNAPDQSLLDEFDQSEFELTLGQDVDGSSNLSQGGILD